MEALGVTAYVFEEQPHISSEILTGNWVTSTLCASRLEPFPSLTLTNAKN